MATICPIVFPCNHPARPLALSATPHHAPCEQDSQKSGQPDRAENDTPHVGSPPSGCVESISGGIVKSRGMDWQGRG
ncbi:MAG: hypothetical protein K8L91_19140, partial [Anaerolineae bacterium]|nr:hypothetical protein [Anaerolineae bacterium]